jgi:hypothetical protein
MVSEFGGVTYAPNSPIATWGYSTVDSPEDFADRVGGLFSALQTSPVLAGFCYTQLTDTMAGGQRADRRKPEAEAPGRGHPCHRHQRCQETHDNVVDEGEMILPQWQPGPAASASIGS